MILDLIACFLLLLFIAAGLWTGAFVQLIRIGGLVAAYIGAPYATPYVAPYVQKHTSELSEASAHGLVFIASMIAIYALIIALAHLFWYVLSKGSITISFIDRILGGVIGGTKAIILLVGIGYGLLLMREALPEVWFEESAYMNVIHLLELERWVSFEKMPELPYLEDISLEDFQLP